MSGDTGHGRFLVWGGVGVLLGLLAVVFGVPGLAVLVAVAVVAAARPGGATHLAGLLVGLGAPLLWIGFWVGAADQVCESGEIDGSGGITCTSWQQAGSIRWPWFVAGATVITLGLALQWRARRRSRRELGEPAPAPS